MRITRDRAKHTIKLSQDAYAKRTIEDLGFEDLKPAKTPFASGSLVLAMPNQDLATAREIHDYQQLNGKLMYSMIQTRPDLAFAVGVTSRYSHNPSHQNLALLKHVFRYYASTSEISLEIGEKDAVINIQRDDDTFTYENTTSPVKLAVTCWVDSD